MIDLRNPVPRSSRVLPKLKKIVSESCLQVYATGRISTTELVTKTVTFCELYSGITMYPYQEQYSRRVVRSVIENDGAEITALFSRQAGKSETIATTVGGMMILLPVLANMPMFAGDVRLEMFKDGLWVGIFAPSQRQATITYGRMRDRLQSKTSIAVLQDREFNLQFSTSNGQTVALTNGSFATAISASEGSNIEGESFKFIICEEAQDISNFKIRKSIHPMGAAYNATIAKIGTATTFKGDFYEAIQRNKNDFKEGRIRVRNHFEYDYRVVIKYNPKYAKYIQKEKDRLGETSDEFKMSYGLEWILQSGMFVDIEQFEVNNTDRLRDRVKSDRINSHVVGIDVAGKSDSTVITVTEVDWENPVICEVQTNSEGEEETYIVYNSWIKDWCEILGDDYEKQYYEILDYLDNFKVAKVVIDATREASLAHRMRANLPYPVIPFIFTTPSKSEMYKHLQAEVRAGRARVPFSQEARDSREYKRFSEQLGDLQKSYSGKNMVVHHPPERDARDDYPDSWALAVLGAKDEIDNTVVKTEDNKILNDSRKPSPYNRGRNSITARRRR